MSITETAEAVDVVHIPADIKEYILFKLFRQILNEESVFSFQGLFLLGKGIAVMQ